MTRIRGAALVGLMTGLSLRPLLRRALMLRLRRDVERINDGDYRPFLDAYAEDAVLHFNDGQHRWAGDHRGKQAIERFLRDFVAAGLKAQLKDLWFSGPPWSMTVIGRLDDEARGPGGELRTPTAWSWSCGPAGARSCATTTSTRTPRRWRHRRGPARSRHRSGGRHALARGVDRASPTARRRHLGDGTNSVPQTSSSTNELAHPGPPPGLSHGGPGPPSTSSPMVLASAVRSDLRAGRGSGTGGCCSALEPAATPTETAVGGRSTETASGGSDGACYGKTQSSGGARGPRAQPVRAERNRLCPHHPPQAGHAAQRAGDDGLAGNVRDPHDARLLHGPGRVRQLLEHRRRHRSRVRTRVRGAVGEDQRDRALQPLRRQALLDDPHESRSTSAPAGRASKSSSTTTATPPRSCSAGPRARRAEPRLRAPRNGALHDGHHRLHGGAADG